MIFAIRCHACIMAGEVHKNVVVTYDGDRLPSQLLISDIVSSKDISISPFTGEIHSTIDYNGIAVVGACPLSVNIPLSVSTLRDTVAHLAALSATSDTVNRDTITFYSLG